MISQKTLKELLHYDPDTGIFTWIKKTSKYSHVVVGSEAGSFEATGYRRICLFEKRYSAHRLAFLYVNGNFPKCVVDHINTNTLDNRWSNLRECSVIENSYNTRLLSANTSGIKGVTWDIRACKWKAQLSASGIPYYLGYFKDLELAELVINEARDLLHGEFANRGTA